MRACVYVCVCVRARAREYLYQCVCGCQYVGVSTRVGGGRRGACVRVCVGVCVVGMTVKRPALPPCAIDGRYRNHFEPFYFVSFFINNILPQIGPESA